MQRAPPLAPPAPPAPPAQPCTGYEKDGEWVPGERPLQPPAAAERGDVDAELELALALSLHERAADIQVHAEVPTSVDAGRAIAPMRAGGYTAAPSRAAEAPPSSVLGSITCPISQCVMTDPVVTASGQTYEREHIESWFRRCEQQGLPLSDPLSNTPLASSTLVANIAVRSLALEYGGLTHACAAPVPPPAPPPMPPPPPQSALACAPQQLGPALAQLRSMGFDDEVTNRRMLDAAGGSVERALEMLLP